MAAKQVLTPEELQSFNNELEKRVEEAIKDKTKWKKVFPDLMAADIFVVAQLSDKTDAQGQRLMNLLTMQNKSGHLAVPFFTNPAKMAAIVGGNNASFNVMRLNTVKFLSSIKGKTAILNPGTPSMKVFSPFDINILTAEYADKMPDEPEQDIEGDLAEGEELVQGASDIIAAASDDK